MCDQEVEVVASFMKTVMLLALGRKLNALVVSFCCVK